MKIPCETLVRMAHITQGHKPDHDPIFQTIRLDNGRVIASNRRLMVMERVEPFEGVFHIQLDDATIEACRTESQFKGVMEIVPNPALAFTMGKTTFGHVTGNIGVFPAKETDLDRWPEVIQCCYEPRTESHGALVWSTDDIGRLAAASPSGVIEFARFINTSDRASVVRDITTSEWVGFFMPRVADGLQHSGAVVPGWV